MVRPIRPAPLAVYTIGYEGRSIDGFINSLLSLGVYQVIDVRKNAFSRKFGFSKSALRTLCSRSRIQYVHYPQLGVPSALRARLVDQLAYRDLFDHYESQVVPGAKDVVYSAVNLVRTMPSTLLCFEADAQMCHRGRLAQTISALSRLPVKHL
jgi:uncharacterized protein (DUF488 family)